MSTDAPAEVSTASTAKRRTGLFWSLGAFAVVVTAGFATAGVLTTDAVARNLHELAWSVWEAADERHDEAARAEADEVRYTDELLGRTDPLQDVLTADLIGDAPLATFQARLDELRTAAAIEPGDGSPSVGRLAPDAAGPVAALPWFVPVWDRYAAIGDLHDLAPARIAAAADRDGVAADLRAVRDDMDAAVHEAAAGAVVRAGEEIAANPSATNRSRLDLEHAVEAVDRTGTPPTTALFEDVAAQVDTLRASHAAEEARKAEPGYAVRAEIEAYARSLAAGIPLDFAWAYEVAGVTSDNWIAGTAQFDEAGDDWALITLSESVADNWPDPNARALVVHEVGHTQVLRATCAVIFADAPFDRDHEMWATAWAIGMGHDLPGAGIEAYGRPSDAQIDASRGCR
ncbi:hypothetical protein [Agromyces sp. LHK192]|uniref:hypothetical protein n=1 Tax=Agromyces sp. LHK192 TaxID=2498704 RepID=UPI000FD82771|nr:hypothetical protein [Agromyces sp. LHK192]